MTPRALRFARFEKLDDFFRVGWMVSKPNMLHLGLVYGLELKWICDCPVPGGFGEYRERVYCSEDAILFDEFDISSNRVNETPARENADDGRGPQLERATEVDC